MVRLVNNNLEISRVFFMIFESIPSSLLVSGPHHHHHGIKMDTLEKNGDQERIWIIMWWSRRLPLILLLLKHPMMMVMTVMMGSGSVFPRCAKIYPNKSVFPCNIDWKQLRSGSSATVGSQAARVAAAGAARYATFSKCETVETDDKRSCSFHLDM